MHQHGPNVLSPDPNDIWVKSQNTLFSKHGHAANQIKGNHEMQHYGSKYFTCRPPAPKTLGDGI